MVAMSQSVKALLLLLAVYAGEDTGTATINSHAVPAWLFLYTPSYRECKGRGIVIFLKLVCSSCDTVSINVDAAVLN